MFNRKDKEDAQKWRDHVQEEREKIISTKCRCAVIIHMKDGSQINHCIYSQGCITFYHWDIVSSHTARDEMRNSIEDLRNQVVKKGIQIGDTFYTPSFINKIEFLEVEDTE